ncbi:MAG: SDR family oxidoreductase [Promethearchaeota archaeon]|nr:MAG: SDR family oxidoreductase [Candidatus Lokiarchaeota archaeon]
MGILEGKSIVITGSGRGIGKAIAIVCAKEGAKVGLTSRTLDELNTTKKEIENLGTGIKVIIKTADITNYNEAEEAFKHFFDELGLLNGVIANAGASRMGDTHDFDPNTFDNILKVNILGVFNTFKAAYPYLKKDNKKSKARFIITGSEAYPQAMPKFAAYTASKYATVGLQKALAAEYKRENITINQILPTMVDTRLLRGRKAGDGNKPDSVMNPWDLNDYYIFLLTDDANRVNDQLIMSSDIKIVKKIISEAPINKKDNWENFGDYLEEKAPKTFNNVKKLKKFIEFLLTH